MYLFGARYYDPEIGRWLGIDPYKDLYPGWSPYNYCLNNPINNFDPDGGGVLPGIFISVQARFNTGYQSGLNRTQNSNNNQSTYASVGILSAPATRIASNPYSGFVASGIAGSIVIGNLVESAGEFVGEMVREENADEAPTV